MPFDAETTCKSIAARVTSLELAIKALAENKVTSKMDALEKTITALKATDGRDADTLKALKAQSEKQAQALEAAMKKKEALSIDQKALDELKQRNDEKMTRLEDSIDKRDKDQRATLQSLFNAEIAKRAAEGKAHLDAQRKQSETQANQSIADSEKKTAETLQKQQALIEKTMADHQKSLEKQLAQIDIQRLESRLKLLEVQVKDLPRA